jgi:hypothetical protein
MNRSQITLGRLFRLLTSHAVGICGLIEQEG